ELPPFTADLDTQVVHIRKHREAIYPTALKLLVNTEDCISVNNDLRKATLWTPDWFRTGEILAGPKDKKMAALHRQAPVDMWGINSNWVWLGCLYIGREGVLEFVKPKPSLFPLRQDWSAKRHLKLVIPPRGVQQPNRGVTPRSVLVDSEKQGEKWVVSPV